MDFLEHIVFVSLPVEGGRRPVERRRLPGDRGTGSAGTGNTGTESATLSHGSTGTDANVPLRGVEAAAPAVRDDLRIVSGRMFEWGKNEVIVGAGAAREFAGLEVGGVGIRIGTGSGRRRNQTSYPNRRA